MSWPWSESHVPRVARSGSRRNAASTSRPSGTPMRTSRRRSMAVTRRRPSVAAASAVVERLGRWAEPGSAAHDLERLRRQRGERPSRGDVTGPRDIDRVVALVHPGRLEVVRRRAPATDGQAGDASRRRRSAPAPRCSCRSTREPSSDFESLRWIMTSRSRPMRPSKSARNRSVAAGSDRSIPAAQAWAASRQKPSRSRSMPCARQASAMSASSVTFVPRPKPLPGAVLEHDHRPIGRPVDLGRHQGEPVGQSGDPGRHARPAV